jgi:hypothetical protein
VARGRKAIQSFRAARSTTAFGRAVRVCGPVSLLPGLKSRPIRWKTVAAGGSGERVRAMPTSQNRDVGHPSAPSGFRRELSGGGFAGARGGAGGAGGDLL